jgi:hypothetical protein
MLNLPTTCMTDLKATIADLKVPAALVGDSPFGALLSQAMDEGSLQGAGGAVAQAKSSSSLDLPALLLAFLGENVETSGQATQATAGPALQTASNKDLKASDRPAAGSTRDEGTVAGTNLKSEQQLQNLVMRLLALVITTDAGAGGQTAVAKGSDSGEEKAAAEPGNGLTTGVKDGDGDGTSHRSKASSNSGASGSASETDNRHLLDTVALLLFTGLEAITQEPGRESGASGETQSLLPKDGGTETEIAPVPAQPAAGGPAVENPGVKGRETVALPGDELNGFAARLLGAGTDAAASTGTTAVRAEFALTPAGEAGADENSLTLQISTYWGSAPPPPAKPDGASPLMQISSYWGSAPPPPANAATRLAGIPASPLISANAAGSVGQTSRVGQAAGGVQDGAAAGTEGAGSASSDGVVTIVKELTPLLFEGRDENASHDPAAGKESAGAKEGYPITLDEHVSVNDEPTQEQQASGQPGSAGTIERFDRVMEQVGTGTGPHDMMVRLTVGNDESLVLGLKDLGHTVTVEIRGSNQGMINLLQSQRDVIISHLEGKDISANIVIDPNASGTPEKQERRGTRQRTSAARAKVSGGFDGLLEVFA